MKALQLLYKQQPVYVDSGLLGHDATEIFQRLSKNAQHSIA
jgi:hypothetical protein